MLASMRRITVVAGIPAPFKGMRHHCFTQMVSTEYPGDSNSLAAQSREPGIESGIANVGPFSPFPMRTKMRLKLLAAGTPTATSPDGGDPARPGRPRRTTPLSSRSVSILHPTNNRRPIQRNSLSPADAPKKDQPKQPKSDIRNPKPCGQPPSTRAKICDNEPRAALKQFFPSV
jgi:hypothetical protein